MSTPDDDAILGDAELQARLAGARLPFYVGATRRWHIEWGGERGGLAASEHAGGTDERAVEERVERICQDLAAGRVIPKHADQLEEAVRRSRVDRSVFRATRFR